jgi:tetratricopeptide (TPR) repeat protein
VALAAGCSDTTSPTTDLGEAKLEQAIEQTAMDPPELPAIATPPPVQSLAKPAGPHGQHDPHAELDPERLIKVALQHDSEGRLELALKTLADGIERFPDAAQLYAVRASLRLQMQQISAALSDLEKAAELAPDDAGIRVNRAQAYRAFGRLDEALADLDVAVAKAPDLIAARFNRGALLYARGEFEKAFTDFDHCIAVDPHAPAPYFNRASTHWELGRSDEAMADLERFLELADNAEWKQAAQDLLDNWKTALAREGAAKTDS